MDWCTYLCFWYLNCPGFYERFSRFYVSSSVSVRVSATSSVQANATDDVRTDVRTILSLEIHRKRDLTLSMIGSVTTVDLLHVV